ncbi:unnamed protein product [Moneuplotes crassus]|uniref:Uncharacterized protein n=1 Tax=Euplotes crassus TaxID=5936 RepID=A0AAD1UEF6_EUPCR|nr:unnamed protein product [Moneuplotes crassus]
MNKKHRELWWFYIILIFLNLSCIASVIILLKKYWKFRIREFYFTLITIFMILTYVTRIIDVIYVWVAEPDTLFNKNHINHHYKIMEHTKVLVSFPPILFNGFSILGYSFRWTNFCVMTTAQASLNERKVVTKENFVKWVYLLTISVLFIIYIAAVIFQKILIACFISTSSVLLFSGILLLFVSNYFLYVLKRDKRELYEQKACAVRTYTIIISLCMIYGSFNLIFDLCVNTGKTDTSTLSQIDDILMMTWFFTELLPSISIMIVLWKSYKEILLYRTLRTSLCGDVASKSCIETILKEDYEEEESIRKLIAKQPSSALSGIGSFKAASWNHSGGLEYSYYRSTSQGEDRSGAGKPQPYLTYY